MADGNFIFADEVKWSEAFIFVRQIDTSTQLTPPVDGFLG